MALISAKTIIASVSLFHITLGYFFLTNPVTIADQAMVYILGEAMGLPLSRGFESPSPALAFLAVVLASIGINDIVTLSLPDEISMIYYWGTQVPVRLLVSMCLLFYSFFFSASSPLYGGTGPRSRPVHHASATWAGDGLKNRVFFTFMFIETISWFWIWTTLREERDQLLDKEDRRRSNKNN